MTDDLFRTGLDSPGRRVDDPHAPYAKVTVIIEIWHNESHRQTATVNAITTYDDDIGDSIDAAHRAFSAAIGELHK